MTATDRIPPFSEEAEKAAMGCMLMDPARVIPMAQSVFKLRPEMFYVQFNRVLCEFLYTRSAAGGMIDLLLVTQSLRDQGMLDAAGGNSYIENLVEAVSTPAHAEHYCDIVRQKFLLRQVVEVSQGLQSDAYCCERGDKLIQSAGEAFGDLVEDVTRERSNADEMAEQLQKWQEAHECFYAKKPVPLSGKPLPWACLNQLIGGLEPGLNVLAGRPSAGKTSMEGCWSTFWAERGIPVARVTLDMTRKRLLMRDACRLAGVSAPKLKFGYADKGDLAKVEEAQNLIATWPMYITDRVREIGAICTYARAMKIRHGIQVLTVDHATLVTVSTAGKGWDKRREVSYVTGKLKELGLELQIPVVLLSQLSRGLEKEGKTPRPPRLSDLKESGSLEEDATTVTFAYKDTEVAETKSRRPVWIDVQKNQDGETGAVEFWLRPHYFRFDQAEENFKDPEPRADIRQDPNKPAWAI